MTSSSMLRLADRPVMRGRLHLAAVLAVIPVGVIVIVASSGARAVTAVAIYLGSLVVSFGASAAYHRGDWSEGARNWMQRLDHAAIHLLIAGTYVPLGLVALPTGWGVPLVAAVGCGAVFGVIRALVAPHRMRRIGYALYPILGWAAVAVAPALWRHLTTAEVVLIVAGGVLYTAGFPILVRQSPDPWPRVFGYHEIWHTFTVLAASAHFVAVVLITT